MKTDDDATYCVYLYEKKINTVERGKRRKKWKCPRTRTPHNTILDAVFLLHAKLYIVRFIRAKSIQINR